MKKTILFIFSFIAISLNAQDLTVNTTQTINWNKEYTKTYSYLQSGLAVDSDGNKIVVGGFDGVNVDFGTNDTISSEKNTNIFIAKYDSSNNLIFVKNIGGILSEGSVFASGYANDYASDVKIDSDNNIYVLATIDVGTEDTVDLDPEHPETNSIITNYTSLWTTLQNIFIIKYSPDGKMLWYREIKDDITDESCNLCIDSNNDVWVAGILGGMDNVDFDPDNEHADSADIVESTSFQTGFVAHYNSNGDFIEVKSIGDGFLLNLIACVAPSGNMYLTGSFSASETTQSQGLSLFENSDSAIYITSLGDYELVAENTDIFILKCNTSGNIEWVKTISSTSYNVATDIAIYGNEYVCISGRFTGSSIDFDTDNSLSYDTRTSASSGSGFVATYDTDGNLKMLKTVDDGTRTRIQCLDVTDNGTVAVAGDFMGNVLFDTISLNTSSSNPNPFIALIDTAGNWYDAGKIDNDNYASITNIEIASDSSAQFIGFEAVLYDAYDIQNIFTGTAKSELFNTVLPDTTPIYLTITDTVCYNYTAPSGKRFDTSGVYTDTVAGLTVDTIYTIKLTVFELNADVSIDGNVLTAPIVQDANYQWINCETNTTIEGGTNQIFTATENGNYAVIIDNSVCIDTSDCITVTSIGIGDILNSEGFKIFPNPTSDVLHIKSFLDIKQLNLFDINGNLVLCQLETEQIDIKNLPKGIYIVKAITDSGMVYTEEVVKE